MRKFISSLFIWWRGESLGTSLFTWHKGIYVGCDCCGNKYFRSRNDEKRWVLYAEDFDASSVSPIWHGWLHQTVNEIPSADDELHGVTKNMTGTVDAYHPNKFEKQFVNEYAPWSPNN